MSPSLRRAAGPLAILALLAGGATGCSLGLDFEDECSGNGSCGSGRVCQSGYCVSGSAQAPDAGGPSPLVNDLCPQLVGASEAEVRAGKALLIGALSPATGALAATGRPVERAIFLAVEEINQVGGIDGRKLAVLACDDGTADNDLAERAATHLIEVGQVPAIVGPAASGTLIEVFSAVTHDAEVVLISPSATSPSITTLADDGLVWRTPPSDDLQGNAIAQYLLAEKAAGDGGLEKVAVINRNDTYGNALRTVIQNGWCAAASCEETTYFTKTYSDASLGSDLATAVQGLEAFGPDVTVLVGFLDDGVDFLNLAGTRAGIRKRFILTDGMKEAPLVDRVESAAVLEGILGTAPATPDNPNTQTFELAYRAKWNTAPSIFNAQAYDATYLLALAIAGAGRDATPGGPDIARQLRRMTGGQKVISVGPTDFGEGVRTLRAASDARIDFDGASGPLNFDPNTGEAPADIEAWRVDTAAGKIVSLGVLYTAGGEFRPPAAASAPAPEGN
ncbi:ABC transporter substrate-binding protein [Myxococcota bacterium]|nr:ABC transporter substrate-binding protein [Myxococcota bacterium]